MNTLLAQLTPGQEFIDRTFTLMLIGAGIIIALWAWTDWQRRLASKKEALSYMNWLVKEGHARWANNAADSGDPIIYLNNTITPRSENPKEKKIKELKKQIEELEQ